MNSTQIIDQLQRRFGSADFTKWQFHRWSFYDYVRYPTAGGTQLTFFSIPLGGTDPNSSLGKTMEQTNVPKARSFGQVYFFVQQIRTHLHVLAKNRQHATISGDADVITSTYSDMMNALLNLSGQGVLNFPIGSKHYFDIVKPFETCPPGFGVNISQHASSASAADRYLFQQSNKLDDVYSVTPAQMIEPEQTVEITIDFPNATSPALTGLVNAVDPRLDVGVILDGYIARPAQ